MPECVTILLYRIQEINAVVTSHDVVVDKASASATLMCEPEGPFVKGHGRFRGHRFRASAHMGESIMDICHCRGGWLRWGLMSLHALAPAPAGTQEHVLAGLSVYTWI